MPDKKLTDNLSNNSPILSNSLSDNEIIKALECCVLYKQICPETCPMVNVRQCKVDLRKSTLDLINRLQAENSNLTSDLTSLQKDLTSLKAENERLKSLNSRQEAEIVSLKTAKSEAYKEFAERLKEKKMQSTMDRRICTFEMIDNLLKEMGGEDNASKD